MTSETQYVPNQLLSRLVGCRLYSVEFVLNDYLQIFFDGPPGCKHVILNCYVWPQVDRDGHRWRESELGYADALRQLASGTVLSTAEATGSGITIEVDSGTISVHPTASEVFVEIAHLSGFDDGSWMVWRPGEESFEDLA